MSIIIWAGAAAAVAAVALLVLLIASARAYANARGAVQALREEVEAAQEGRFERYRTRMPARAAFDDEKWCSANLLDHFEQQLFALADRGLFAKLGGAWRHECKKLAASARKKGMTEAMLGELMAVIAMANATNALAAGYQVEVDEQFKAG